MLNNCEAILGQLHDAGTSIRAQFADPPRGRAARGTQSRVEDHIIREEIRAARQAARTKQPAANR